MVAIIVSSQHDAAVLLDAYGEDIDTFKKQVSTYFLLKCV